MVLAYRVVTGMADPNTTDAEEYREGQVLVRLYADTPRFSDASRIVEVVHFPEVDRTDLVLESLAPDAQDTYVNSAKGVDEGRESGRIFLLDGDVERLWRHIQRLQEAYE